MKKLSEMKKLSCGFIIKDINTGKFLGCHPYGRKDNLCDIPKGGIEEGENYLETALRELSEETSMSKEELSNIKEIGRVYYNHKKDLYIFTADANVDLSKLTCRSMFDWFGKMVPEMVGYELGDTNIYFPNMKRVVEKCI